MDWILAVISAFIILFLVDGFENPELYLFCVPFSLLFHSMISDIKWSKFFKLVLKLISNVPKAVIEGFEISILKMSETFEVLDISEDEETEKILCITLTPKSVVFLSEGDRIHVHILRR